MSRRLECEFHQAIVECRTPVLDLILSPIAILAGCVLLYVGGDMLVSASTFIADRIGMSPIAIGATTSNALHGAGFEQVTSLPEPTPAALIDALSH